MASRPGGGRRRGSPGSARGAGGSRGPRGPSRNRPPPRRRRRAGLRACRPRGTGPRPASKNRPSSWRSRASNATSLPPGKARYSVARDTPAARAMSSAVVFATPQRPMHSSIASTSRASRRSERAAGATVGRGRRASRETIRRILSHRQRKRCDRSHRRRRVRSASSSASSSSVQGGVGRSGRLLLRLVPGDPAQQQHVADHRDRGEDEPLDRVGEVRPLGRLREPQGHELGTPGGVTSAGSLLVRWR